MHSNLWSMYLVLPILPETRRSLGEDMETTEPVLLQDTSDPGPSIDNCSRLFTDSGGVEGEQMAAADTNDGVEQDDESSIDDFISR